MTTHRYPRRMEIKRHRLLEAAQEIFLEKGFHAASMSDIAKKAEVSPPHIYNFYKNKADLAMAVQERMNQEIFDTLKNSMFEERSVDKDKCLDNLLKPERAALMLTLITEATRDTRNISGSIRRSSESFFMSTITSIRMTKSIKSA